MIKYQSLVLPLLLVVAQISANLSPLNEIVKSEISFSKAFSHNVYNDYKDNAVCSPLSAYLVLAQTAYGAEGNTAKQLNAALSLSKNVALVSNDFSNLLKELKEAKDIELNIANRLIVVNGLELNQNFIKHSSDVFDSQISSFIGKPKDLVDDINNWVDNKTNHKIQSLFESDDIDDLTSLILLNALYFNGAWENQFDPRHTRILEFTDLNKQIHNVSMMLHVGKIFRHGTIRKLGADFIELPYKNNDFKMVLVVPTDEEVDAQEFNKLGEELKKLTYNDLNKFSVQSEATLVLPKFKFESYFDLKPALEKMDVTDMFTDKANFKPLVKNVNDKLVVSKVVQKTVIEVNELGTEAVVSTGLTSSKRSGNALIRATKPFYFSIVSDKYGVLFSGKVLLPKY